MLLVCGAGVNPQSLRGTKTGVFIGNMFNDAAEPWASDTGKMIGYALLGCCRNMLANWVSYLFDLKGTCLK